MQSHISPPGGHRDYRFFLEWFHVHMNVFMGVCVDTHEGMHVRTYRQGICDSFPFVSFTLVVGYFPHCLEPCCYTNSEIPLEVFLCLYMICAYAWRVPYSGFPSVVVCSTSLYGGNIHPWFTQSVDECLDRLHLLLVQTVLQTLKFVRIPCHIFTTVPQN